jgi:hypothetical protein
MTLHGEDLMRTTYALCPNLPLVLVEDTTSANCFWLLQMYGLSAAFPPSLSFSPRYLQNLFYHLTSPESVLALDPYFAADGKVVRRQIDVPSQRSQVLETLTADFAARDHVQPHDLELIFEEILNNALFHAFRNRHLGVRRERESIERPLESTEEIIVEWGVTEAIGALAVSDNRGLLSRQDVWDRFYRQTSLTGLLDTDGRGLYLAHLLSRQVLVSIAPGRRTHIAVFFGPAAKNEKLISIRVV